MPTLDDRRIAQLAYYHVQGFCFFRSYKPERKTGAWLEPGNFLMLGYLFDADWGNPRLRHFMETTSVWERVFVSVLAEGYFKHTMFKKPGAQFWAWAIEWNGRSRVFGLYGSEAERNAFEAGMPTLKADFGFGDTINGVFTRVETPLADEEDVLFDVPFEFDSLKHAAPHWR